MRLLNYRAMASKASLPIFFLAVAVCIAPATAASTTPATFKNARIAYPSFSTTAIAVGNFTGNGKGDVAAAVPFAIDVFPGTSTGALGTAIVTPLVTSCGTAIYVADFNGDGKLDILCSLTNGSFQILLGNGNGTFGVATPASFGGYSAITVGDVNGDGLADVITSSYDSLYVYFAQPNGTFSAPVSYKYRNGTITALLIADVNGDGIPDLVAVDGTVVTVNYGLGKGVFGLPSYYQVKNAQTVQSLFTADLNNDGKQDVLVSFNGNAVAPVPHLAVFLTGSGNGLTQTDYITVSPISQVQSADLNGDGFPDVAARSTDGTTLQFLLNDGNGQLAPATEISVPQTYFTLANLRGTAITDIVITDGNTIQVLDNPGNGVFNPGIQEFGGQEGSPCILKDFNGDGVTDMACLNQYQIALFFGTGQASAPFAAQPEIELITSATAIAAADFNGDGTVDIAAFFIDDTIQVLTNNGSGVFTATQHRSIAGAGATAMVAGDFNGDGMADVFTSAGVLLEGLGTGQFANPITILSSPALPNLVAADLEGNGNLDIVGVPLGQSPIVLLNSGNAEFSTMVLTGVEAQGQPAIGDVNGDGKLDLLFPAGLFGVSVVLGAGNNSFLQTKSYNPDFWPPMISAVVADFNGDGVPDLAYGIGTYSIWVATGNGDGTFNVPATGFGVADATFLRIFGNAKKPILVAGSAPATILLHSSN